MREVTLTVHMWEGVREYHGVGKRNESGDRLLSFCAMDSLSILNTYVLPEKEHPQIYLAAPRQ